MVDAESPSCTEEQNYPDATKISEFGIRNSACIREEAKAEAAAARAVRAAAAEALKWEECVEGGEAYYVTAMLASVVRSLAEGPKTEHELDQVIGRPLHGLQNSSSTCVYVQVHFSA